MSSRGEDEEETEISGDEGSRSKMREECAFGLAWQWHRDVRSFGSPQSTLDVLSFNRAMPRLASEINRLCRRGWKSVHDGRLR